VAPQPDTGWSKGVVQWHLNAALFGTESDEYESRNILWTTPMPDDGPGVSSPILVGNKLFVTAEGNVLICISAADGKVLWARSSTYADAATSDERQKAPEVFAQTDKLTAQLNESLQTYCQDPGNFRKKPEVCAGLDACRKVNRLVEKTDRAKYPGQSGCEAGEAASTPVSDGQHVYVLYGSGVAACFDLDGNRQWTTVVNVRNSEHGYAASPCLVDGKLVIKSQEYLGAVALDSKTGRVVTRMPVWKAEGLNAYSAPLPLSIGGEKVVVQSFGVVTRVKDGRTLSQAFAPPYYNIADYASPTAEGRRLCSFILPKSDSGIRLAFQTLPEELTEPLVMKDTRECEFDAKKFPCWFSYNHNASPLLYQGLAYVMSVDGVLTVIDAAKGEIVYQKLLDFNPIMMHNGPIVRAGCSGSPTLGGKHIYLWDNQGTCVVIEPGRTFKQLARNRIDQVHYYYGPARNECMISNPVFSGKRMYVRAENHLYCMGEKAHN
jgi:outer membrane protein assembly factor BamB